MSRIDDALRRLHKSETHTRAGESHNIDAVVPSWQYDRLPSEEPRRVAAPAVRRQVARGVAPQFSERIVGGPAAERSQEQYRRLAATLHQTQREKRLRVLMVSSAVAGEGKTLTAANLAMTLSKSYGRRVLLVDADLRRPTLHDMFQVPSSPGLVDSLISDEPISLIEYSPRLCVLPAGRPQSDPMQLLVSDNLRTLLQEAAQAFDWVIVDTPPIVLVPDAHLLAHMVDSAVLVVRSGSTPHELVTTAANTIGKDRIAGVVLNGVSDGDVAHEEAYGYGYGYSYAGSAARK